MAISAPVPIGQNGGSTGETTLVITLTVAVSAGDIIVIRSASGSGSTQNTGFQLASVADDGGNTYAVNVIENRTERYFCAIATAKCETPLGIGDTITLTYGAEVNERAAVADKVSGADQTDWVDQTAVANTSSATPSVGPSGTLEQAAELVIGAFGMAEQESATTFTADGAYTEMARQGSGGTSGNNSRTIDGAYLIVSSTDAVTASGVYSNSEQWAGCLITLKEATGGGSEPQNANVSGHTSGSTFGTVTAAGGPINHPVAGHESPSSFGTVTPRATTSVDVTGHTSVSSFGAVTPVGGAAAASVPGHESVSSFGTVTPAGGAADAQVPGHESVSTFGDTTPTLEGATIVPGHTSVSQFGTVTPAAGAVDVDVPGHTSLSLFGTVRQAGTETLYSKIRIVETGGSAVRVVEGYGSKVRVVSEGGSKVRIVETGGSPIQIVQ